MTGCHISLVNLLSQRLNDPSFFDIEYTWLGCHFQKPSRVCYFRICLAEDDNINLIALLRCLYTIILGHSSHFLVTLCKLSLSLFVHVSVCKCRILKILRLLLYGKFWLYKVYLFMVLTSDWSFVFRIPMIVCNNVYGFQECCFPMSSKWCLW